MIDWSRLAPTFAMDAGLSPSITYRSSGYDLSSAGEKAKKDGVPKSRLIQECKDRGLDKEQISHVLGGYED